MILRMIAVGLKPEVQEANAHFRNRCKAEVDAWRLLQAEPRHSLPQPECPLRLKPDTRAAWPQLPAARFK